MIRGSEPIEACPRWQDSRSKAPCAARGAVLPHGGGRLRQSEEISSPGACNGVASKARKRRARRASQAPHDLVLLAGYVPKIGASTALLLGIAVTLVPLVLHISRVV